MAESCPACGSSQGRAFFCLNAMPVCSMALLDSPEEALAVPRGLIDLVFCEECGFIYNRAFDPLLLNYAPGYESSQAYSPRFNAFANDLASELVTRYDLTGKRVLEIGCGNGEFLTLLCSHGVREGIGVDPAASDLSGPDAPPILMVREPFQREHGLYAPDLVCCRHTLEHIPAVADFVGGVRTALPPGIPVYFEVPDTERILAESAFCDIYYEHCSYFTQASLRGLFDRKGFTNVQVIYGFDDQYLLLDARAGRSLERPPTDADQLERLSSLLDRFAANCRRAIERKREQIDRYAREGKRCVVWGGGSKGVALLNVLRLDAEIDYVVDINPLKQQRYVAGTGHLITGQGALTDREPDVVLLMNPIYTAEVEAMLAERRVKAEIIAM